jgi:hypothetical protein
MITGDATKAALRYNGPFAPGPFRNWFYQIHRQDPYNEMPWVRQLDVRSTFVLVGSTIGLIVGLAIDLALSIWRR